MGALNHLHDISLKQTIANCCRGQRDAQKDLYYRFYSYGLTVCLHYAPTREEAEEILHDGFLKVFRKIHQYRGDSAFRSWFRSILVREAISYFRKKSRRDQENLLQNIARPEPVENEATRILEQDDVIYILQKLPPSYRLVFNLFVLEGYQHHEIAKLLDISVGTSKSNLSRAKQKLRLLLNPAKVMKD